MILCPKVQPIFQTTKSWYKNLYNGIDAVFTLENHALKYEFVVSKGANPNEIQYVWIDKYDNIVDVNKSEKGIKVASENFTLTDINPISFTKSGKSIQSNYVIENSVVKFNVEKANETIIIDPKIDWSTYLGGSAGDVIFGSAADTNLNLYVVGTTSSNTSISTTGSHQASYGSNIDAFVAKFNKKGERQWATYYGGSVTEGGSSINLDNSGNLYFCGSSSSTNAISTTGVHQTARSGGLDAILVKMSLDGTRIWGTYYGGSNDDVAFGLAIHSSGDPVIVGQTESTNNIGTVGTFRNTAFGKIDGFLARFAANNGTRVFGTYLGGTEDDMMTAVVCDGSGNIYVAGQTASTGIATVTGATTKFAGFDVITYRMTGSGARDWAAYFGHNSTDVAHGIAIDNNGEIVVVGASSSNVNIGFGLGIHQSVRAGALDGFILILRTTGARRISTFYGENNNDEVRSIAIDEFNTYHITGYTESTAPASNTDSMTTRNAIRRNLAGKEDIFYAQFNSSLQLLYGTKLGRSQTDIGYTIAKPAKSGVIYVSGGTESDTMATSGAFQSARGGNQDGIIYKFRNLPCSIKPKPILVSPDTLICQQDIVVYKPVITAGHTYEWYVIGGTLLTPRVSDSAVIRWGTGATGRIKLVELNTKYCEDSIFQNITLRSVPKPTIGGRLNTCVGTIENYSTTNNANNTYQWLLSNPIGNITSGATTNATTINWTDTGVTLLSIIETNDAGCKDTITRSIRIFPKPAVTISGNAVGCTNDQISFTASGFDFSTYQWTVNNATIVSGASSAVVTIRLTNSGLLTSTMLSYLSIQTY